MVFFFIKVPSVGTFPGKILCSRRVGKKNAGFPPRISTFLFGVATVTHWKHHEKDRKQNQEIR